MRDNRLQYAKEIYLSQNESKVYSLDAIPEKRHDTAWQLQRLTCRGAGKTFFCNRILVSIILFCE